VPFAAFSRWFAQTGMANLATFLSGTAAVAGVVRTDALSGSWGSPGDRRRVVFADGNSAVEEILEIAPQRFRYEVWNLTNDTGRFITYAVGEFVISDAPSGTRLVWTYAFQPKAQPPDGWFIRSYVQNDYRLFMQTGLAAIGQRAAVELAPAAR
jgi:hypothetical protein